MPHSYSQSGIGNPFRLTLPRAGGAARGNPGGWVEGPGKQGEPHRRILVVEDEFLLSAVLAADLQDAGYDVLGPFATLAQAMEGTESESFDGAILDINLRGELVYPLAEELLRREIPFLFLSGYEASNMPPSFRSHARLAKPADPELILDAVRNMLNGRMSS